MSWYARMPWVSGAGVVGAVPGVTNQIWRSWRTFRYRRWARRVKSWYAFVRQGEFGCLLDLVRRLPAAGQHENSHHGAWHRRGDEVSYPWSLVSLVLPALGKLASAEEWRMSICAVTPGQTLLRPSRCGVADAVVCKAYSNEQLELISPVSPFHSPTSDR